MTKVYLGDGVYLTVDRERGALKLTAENGVTATDTIYLEPVVWQNMRAYINALQHQGVWPTEEG